MQRLTMVRYMTKPDQTAENERLARAVFRELDAAQPEDVAYAIFRNADEFVHLFVNLRDSDSDALTGLDSFKAYSEEIGARCIEPPQVTRLDFAALESYGFAKVPVPA